MFSDRGCLPFMTKNISATLDFNKSVKSFQLNVTKVLDFSKITEWDGKKLKEQEEERSISSGLIVMFYQYF
jgi:hypothetical protein